MTTQAEISAQDCIEWVGQWNWGAIFPDGNRYKEVTIAHLRRIQEVEAERDSLRTILDQHIAALRSTAWAITDKACGSADDIVAEAKRVRAELEKCRRDAARYRWIRDNEQLVNAQLARLCGDGSADDFDEAIDAAISAGEGRMICLHTTRGYWTGFTFVKSYMDSACKYYRTRIGAERAAKYLSERHRVTFYVTTILSTPTKCPRCEIMWETLEVGSEP